jgi:hypothetical protein
MGSWRRLNHLGSGKNATQKIFLDFVVESTYADRIRIGIERIGRRSIRIRDARRDRASVESHPNLRREVK